MKRVFIALMVSVTIAGAEQEFGNKAVKVVVSEKDMTWRAQWLEADAALHGVGFAVEVDGKTLKPESPSMEVLRKAKWIEIRQTWTNGVEVTRVLRTPAEGGRGEIMVSGRIANRTGHEVSLGTQHLIDLYGPWHVGNSNSNPASVFIAGASELQCEPGDTAKEREYRSSGVLGLAQRQPAVGFVAGFLTAKQARPDLSAVFRAGEGGTRLLAHQPFLGRKLGTGETVELDTVYVGAARDGYAALEAYGDAVAANAEQPARKGATALWCSWYAHRMAMSEDLVLANAAVAARYFKPLGLEIMQLDHGWQRGDITGDWVPNERFPHGLRWLADELRKRYEMKLGLWIAPTDVAETSETFRLHPDWMLKDEHGKPRANWKWYWKPNPNCYELDASNNSAKKWIEEVFARLTSEGAAYYKIDFIASSGGEQFFQSDGKITRGWGVLREAMEALRRGAGPEAWIRYCQTPPVLSVGLANSVIGGNDTLDAGLNGNIEVLRTSARSLAAGYWLNDRLYHREVCDMSVRMQAEVEEARLRLAIMTLAGCSISFSDELQYLPPSRIRMMQCCLPPGNPPMKPLDLFERAIPSVWWIHCKNQADEWEVVGLFNFEKQAEERTVELASLGFPAGTEASVFEFWEQKFLGNQIDKLTMTLPPQSSRILAIHRVRARPQVIGTDLHLLQGYHELKKASWDPAEHVLSGECQRMPGITGQLFIYVPKGYAPHFDFPLNESSATLTHLAGPVWSYEIKFEHERQGWHVPFDVAK